MHPRICGKTGSNTQCDPIVTVSLNVGGSSSNSQKTNQSPVPVIIFPPASHLSVHKQQALLTDPHWPLRSRDPLVTPLLWIAFLCQMYPQGVLSSQPVLKIWFGISWQYCKFCLPWIIQIVFGRLLHLVWDKLKEQEPQSLNQSSEERDSQLFSPGVKLAYIWRWGYHRSVLFLSIFPTCCFYITSNFHQALFFDYCSVTD